MAKKTKKEVVEVEEAAPAIEVVTTKERAKTLDERIAEAVAIALKESLPLVAGVMANSLAQAQQGQKNAEYLALQAARLTGERCQGCRQVLPAGVKQGEHPHRQVIVLPQQDDYAEFFQGIGINGVRYLSNHRGHLVTVPADAPIEETIQRWEQNEKVQANGRKKMHNSGDVSNFNAAQQGWR